MKLTFPRIETDDAVTRLYCSFAFETSSRSAALLHCYYSAKKCKFHIFVNQKKKTKTKTKTKNTHTEERLYCYNRNTLSFDS